MVIFLLMIILFICYKIRPLLNNSGLILNINLVKYKQTRTKINSSSIKQFGAGEGKEFIDIYHIYKYS